MVLKNEGTLSSKVYIDLIDPDAVFKLQPTGDSRTFVTDNYDEDSK